jgi:tetratricopeptide (TPR) repeat protein
VLASELGVTLGHLDVRVTENLRKLVEIAAVHHVPGREGVAQVVKPEVLNLCPDEQIFKTTLQTRAPSFLASIVLPIVIDQVRHPVQSNQGKYVDAIGLMKKAIAADPDFPDAYYDLAANYRSVLDLQAERNSILKAYSLRDSASEPIRLAIIALYDSSATQDLYETERNYRNWTELYPWSAQAWNGLSVVDRDLGHHADALVAAQRALELRPTIVGLYANLAYEQMTLGNPKAALATCERALAKGLDGDYIREHCFQAAYALHDAALVQKERDWAGPLIQRQSISEWTI